jgi:opacity protein-like surface antigen
MKKIASVAFSLLLLGSVAAAASPDQPVDAQAAFAKLKTLAGQWQAETPKGKAQVSYELIAGGSVLVERDSMPGEGSMITAYHLDGDQLVLTHYCMAGNQPHMVAQRFDAGSGELEFVLNGGANLNAGPGHMQNARFHLISANRLDAEWNFLKHDNTRVTEDLHYTRVK